MGRSKTYEYWVVVTLSSHDITFTPLPWYTDEAGLPTESNFVKFVEDYNESMKPGGDNDHLSANVPGGLQITSARLETTELNPRVVAEWSAPSFDVGRGSAIT